MSDSFQFWFICFRFVFPIRPEPFRRVIHTFYNVMDVVAHAPGTRETSIGRVHSEREPNDNAWLITNADCLFVWSRDGCVSGGWAPMALCSANATVSKTPKTVCSVLPMLWRELILLSFAAIIRSEKSFLLAASQKTLPLITLLFLRWLFSGRTLLSIVFDALNRMEFAVADVRQCAAPSCPRSSGICVKPNERMPLGDPIRQRRQCESNRVSVVHML